MFISEEIHRDLISKFKASYKPYLSTQENVLLKSLNDVPGLYCSSITVEEGQREGTDYIEIYARLKATRLGILNYGLLFDQLTNGLDQTTTMWALVFNKLRPDDPNDPGQWPGIDTGLSLSYRVYVKDPEGLARARHDTLFSMNTIVIKTQYAKSLLIKMDE